MHTPLSPRDALNRFAETRGNSPDTASRRSEGDEGGRHPPTAPPKMTIPPLKYVLCCTPNSPHYCKQVRLALHFVVESDEEHVVVWGVYAHVRYCKQYIEIVLQTEQPSPTCMYISVYYSTYIIKVWINEMSATHLIYYNGLSNKGGRIWYRWYSKMLISLFALLLPIAQHVTNFGDMPI